MLSKNEKFKVLLVLLLFVSAIGVFLSDAYVPALPMLVHALKLTPSQAKLTVSLYLLSLSVAQLLCGPLSDKLGRQRIILAGMIICTIGTIFCIFAPDFSILLLGRILQGIGASAMSSLFRAVIRDIWSGSELAKVVSIISSIFSVIPAVAPLIGGYLSVWFSWRAVFVFILIYTVIGYWMVRQYLPETNKQLNPHAFRASVLFKNYWQLLTNKTFFGYTFCSAMIMAGFFAYVTASPFLLQNVMGMTPIQYSWSMIWIIAASLFGKMANIKLVDILKPAQIIKIGLFFMLLSGCLMLITSFYPLSPFLLLIFPSMIYIFAGGFVFANAFSGSLESFPEKAGTAGALYSSLLMAGSFLGSLIVTWLHMKTTLPLAIVYLIFALMTWGVFGQLVLKHKA